MTIVIDQPRDKTAVSTDATARAHLNGLGYIGLEVSDLKAWTSFAREVLGLQVRSGPRPDVLFLKMDDKPYRFILIEGPADDIAFAGWEVADGAALDAFAAYLTDLNVPFTWGQPQELALRGVDRMLRVRDPNGVLHEAYTAIAAGEPFTPQTTKGGFVTDKGGLGHIVFGSGDYAASVAFARQVLGAGLSDTIEQFMTDTMSVHVTFMHVNERHHSIAFANRGGAKKLHHFMIEVARIDDVGRARDRHIQSGLAVAQDIGQHPNDRMISYYGATPSGFLVEFGWGGVKVDMTSWQPAAYDRMSDWGHRPLASAPRPHLPKTNLPTQEIAMSVAGNWNLTIMTPMGAQKADLSLMEDLTGEITSMGMPEDVYDGALAGDKLSFKADVTKPFPMTLAFSLIIAGASLSGEVLAGPLGATPVTGERA